MEEWAGYCLAVRIAAIGDSIVNADRSLAWWIAEATGGSLVRVSQGGATATAVVGQLERLDGRYDLAVLTVGTNDVLVGTPAESFRQSLDTILAGLLEQADRVVVPTIPESLASFPGGRRILRERVAAVNAVLRELADVTLVPGDVELSVDRVHPTVRGQRELAVRALGELGLPSELPPAPHEGIAGSTVQTAAVLAAKSLLRRYRAAAEGRRSRP